MKSLYESILGSTNTGRSTFEVDLGLSVKWCSCNVGANRPEESGLYFAWGDTKGYTESEVKDGMFTSKWYKTLPASRITRNLNKEEDAAYKYLGGNWRIPSIKEFEELNKNTTRTFDIVKGIKGVKYTGKNGNSIFMPFSGSIINGSFSYDDYFCCWTSSIFKKGKDGSYYYTDDGKAMNFCSTYERSTGMVIRGVYENIF